MATIEVSVWTARLADWLGRPEWRALAASLNAEEQSRRDQFAFEKDQHVYTLAHGMLRLLLSHAVGGVRAPAEWTFHALEGGRPEVDWDLPDEAIRFSLSHTPGWAAVALVREVAVGVDLERLDRPNVNMELVARSWTEGERIALARAPEEDRRHHFFRIWTLKEAFIKGLGTGLSAGLDRFAFTRGADGKMELAACELAGVRPEEWSFAELDPAADVVAAVAAHVGTASLAVEHRSFIPSVWEGLGEH